MQLLTVPISALPAQAVDCTLGQQDCRISIWAKDIAVREADGALHAETAVFLDLEVEGARVVSGALCLNRVPILRDAYLPFAGELVFIDTEGASDPVYTGFGSRYLLGYIAP